MKMVPLLNPIKPRKRAARKTKTIQRAGLAREAYVKRPSQMTGTKPTKRLVARRAVAKRKGTFPNPRAVAGDAVAARELFLFAVNDGDLYRQRISPIIDNLARKVAKGVYDASLAPKIWQYAADDAAKRYAKDYGGSFSVATRRETAAQLHAFYADHVMQESAKFLKPKRATNPDGMYYVQLVRATNEASGHPRKLAIVYDADGVRVDAVPYSYGTYEDDFKRLGYSHHIAMQYQIEITPKEFNWLKGAKRINNPEKSNVVTFHAFNVITRGNGKIQVHDGANTQPAACAIAESLQKKLGTQKVYVASRAYIKKHTGA